MGKTKFVTGQVSLKQGTRSTSAFFSIGSMLYAHFLLAVTREVSGQWMRWRVVVVKEELVAKLLF